jgi:uncharacterized membrane protein YkvA (DUF1232 family)
MILLEKFKEKVKLIKSYISALYIAYKRKDTPKTAKILAAVTVAYALSPIDFIPDFIPVLGYLDDLIILPLLIWICIKLIPKNIMTECIEESKNLWKDGKPKKWIYALPIIAVWLIIIFFILYKIFYKS